MPNNLRRQIRHQTIGYISAALGLVAGLAWNDAIKAFIEKVFPIEESGLFPKFLYAIIVTVIVVILVTYFTKLFKEQEN